jgi:hypothetical protein
MGDVVVRRLRRFSQIPHAVPFNNLRESAQSAEEPAARYGEGGGGVIGGRPPVPGPVVSSGSRGSLSS